MLRHDRIGVVQPLLRAWRQVWNVIGKAKYHLITSSSLAFWPAVLLVAGVIAASAEQPLRIPIVVDFPDGAETAWPVACGVPFAVGSMTDAGSLVVVDDAGVVTPSQADVTATWLDGSVRWVMLHFIALPGKKYFAVTGQNPSKRVDAFDEITVL
jgi:hypothetical protein